MRKSMSTEEKSIWARYNSTSGITANKKPEQFLLAFATACSVCLMKKKGGENPFIQ